VVEVANTRETRGEGFFETQGVIHDAENIAAKSTPGLLGAAVDAGRFIDAATDEEYVACAHGREESIE